MRFTSKQYEALTRRQAFGVCARCARHGYVAPRGLEQVECLAAFCEHPSHGGPVREERGPETERPACPFHSTRQAGCGWCA